MTNEEAKVFLDNLKICINEHPIVADWLVEIADRKTESNSEKPNNYEPKICDTCRYYNSNIPCGSTPSACKEADKFAKEFVDGLKKLKLKDEPTISKMEQVDKDINVRSKWEVPPKVEPQTEITTCVSVPACLLEIEDEPQTEEHCETCRHKDECEGATYEYRNTEWWCLGYAPIEDEPQTELVRVKYHCINCAENGSYKCSKCDGEMYYKYDKDEPQTDVYDYKGNGKWERSE